MLSLRLADYCLLRKQQLVFIKELGPIYMISEMVM